MTNFEIDLANVNVDDFQNAIVNYNGQHSKTFQLSGSNDVYTLTGGDDTYCSGSLSQVAFYWEGYVSGQMEYGTDMDLDDI